MLSLLTIICSLKFAAD